MVLLAGAAPSCSSAIQSTPSPDHADAVASPHVPSREQACAARYDAAVAASTAAAARYDQAMREREAAIAAGRRAAEERKESRLRSEAALRQWVINRVAVTKLPCVLAEADYVIGLRLSNRARTPLDCELDELRAGDAAPRPVRHQVLVPQETARFEVSVRSCQASRGAPGGARYTLSCTLSDDNRAEAGIDDPRLRSFVYDADALALSSDAPPDEPFVEPPAPPPPEPAPSRAAFLDACRSAEAR
ncbi:MAG: hypothetical protein U0359_10700 [Byssovorax sp.]